MSAKDSGLGKGLDALLGDTSPADRESNVKKVGLDTLYLDQMSPNPDQPRSHFNESELAQLADSIRENGVLQPILVRADPKGSDNYQIVAGERRWRAAQRANCHEVPVIIRQISNTEALEIALVENLQRHDLNPMEEARAYKRLITEFGGTQEAVAQRLGKSRSYLANTLRLLNLPEKVQEWLETGEFQAGHARAILSAGDPLALAIQVRKKGLSVRQAELLAKKSPIKSAVRHSQTSDPDTQNLEKALTVLVGLKVRVKGSAKTGEVRIRYSTPQQLEQIADKLRGQW